MFPSSVTRMYGRKKREREGFNLYPYYSRGEGKRQLGLCFIPLTTLGTKRGGGKEESINYLISAFGEEVLLATTIRRKGGGGGGRIEYFADL